MATTRIIWTAEEKETVYRTLKDDAIKSNEGFVDLSNDRALVKWREAQRFLQQDRRRPSAVNNVIRDMYVILNMHMDYEKISTFSKNVEANGKPAKQEDLSIKAGPQLRVHPVVIAPKATTKEDVKGLPKVDSSVATTVKDTVADAVTKSVGSGEQSILMNLLAGTAVDTALSEIINRLVGTIEQRLVTSITDKVLENLADVGVVDYSSEVPEDRKSLPKILVCGPISKQQTELLQYFDGVAKLKFVGSDEKASLVATRGKNCDAAVLWTNFINHSISGNAQKAFPGKHVLVTGGMQSLRSAISDVALQLI